MQTIIVLDDSLLQEAARYARTDNPGELIQLALREFVRNRRPAQAAKQKRRLGIDKGRFTVPEDFDAPNAEIEQAFYGA